MWRVFRSSLWLSVLVLFIFPNQSCSSREAEELFPGGVRYFEAEAESSNSGAPAANSRIIPEKSEYYDGLPAEGGPDVDSFAGDFLPLLNKITKSEALFDAAPGSNIAKKPVNDFQRQKPSLKPRDSEALLRVWPYVLKTTSTSVEILWETDVFANSRLLVKVNDSKERRYGGEAFRVSRVYDEESGQQISTDGWVHRVKIGGLEPGSTVKYTLVSLAAPSGPYTVKTPAAGNPLKFVAYGDSSKNPEAHNIVAYKISTEAPQLVLHAGDMLDCEGDQLCGVYSMFSRLVWYSTGSTFVPVPGNNDFYPFNIQSIFYEYFYSYFIDVDDPEAPQGCYEVRYGDLYVLVLNSALLLGDTDVMLQYAGRRLAAAAEDKSIRYRLVSTHIPYYTFSRNYWQQFYSADLKAALHSLMLENRVMAVISGHNHCYEHFNVEGVHYLTLGGGGSPLYDILLNVDPVDQQYYIMSEKTYHYALFTSNGNDLDVVVKRAGNLSTIESFTLEAR